VVEGGCGTCDVPDEVVVAVLLVVVVAVVVVVVAMVAAVVVTAAAAMRVQLCSPPRSECSSSDLREQARSSVAVTWLCTFSFCIR
jgi:hypothetical protein